MIRPAAALLLTLPLVAALPGCGDKVYDGSGSFYDQHPAYRDQPSYMHPSDPDDPDPNAKRPW